jgi:glycoprotease/Kae1 family metallohydrolase
MDELVVLGIESTAHTASAGVVRRGPDGAYEVRSIRSASWSPSEGGIHPREAANHHADVLPGLIQGALEDAAVGARDLSAVAFAQGPGLGPCLRTGASAARALAVTAGVPLVGVNHCVAHLEVGRALLGGGDPVLLYASGGNTQVIAFAGGRYRVFGETLDIGIGNMLDKFGR